MRCKLNWQENKKNQIEKENKSPVRAHVNGKRYLFGSKNKISNDFNLISKKGRVCVLSANSVLVVNRKIFMEERVASHNGH